MNSETVSFLDTPANFMSKSEYVYRSIRTAILNGLIKPDSLLNQAELAEQFQVSRMPIRDAINMLAKEGLVRIILHKGAKVAHFSLKDIQEVYAIRKILEGYAIREAMIHITDEVLLRLEEINRNITKHDAQEDIDSMIRENEQFHRVLYELCGNKRLLDMIENLWSSYPKRIFWEIKGRAKQVVSQHREIIAEIKSRNAEKAEKLVHNHLVPDPEVLNGIYSTFNQNNSISSDKGKKKVNNYYSYS